MAARPTTGTYLDRILENTRAELEVRKRARSFAEIEALALARPAPVPFAAALRVEGIAVIAEVKRASPSKGPIAPGIGARAVAEDYVRGGAAAISVLTDERFFHGSLDDLRDVAEYARARSTPVLRKDFVLDVYQIAEAREAGASAVLLIVAALDQQELSDLLAAAADFGVDALVEVHDEAELERAVDAGATTIGVNNRDLRTFHVDLATTERVAARVPESVTLISESGISTRADVDRVRRAGAHAILVGEALMRADDRAGALRELLQ